MLVYSSWIEIDDIRKDPLESLISEQTVVRIKKLISLLNLPLRKSGRKAELIESVVEFVRTFPDHVLSHLQAHEINLLKRLLAGEEVYADLFVLDAMYTLYSLGWIAVREVRHEPGVVMIVLLDEVAELVGKTMKTFQLSKGCKIARFVTGWAALCGVIPLLDVVEILSSHPEFDGITYTDVLNAVDRFCDPSFISIIPEINKSPYNIGYMSEWVKVIGKPASLMISRKTIEGKTVETLTYQPKRFSYEEIIAASEPLFAPATPNHLQIKALRALGAKDKLNDRQFNKIILEAWLEKQRDKNYPSFGRITERLACTSIESLNEWLAALGNYSNSVPFWRFLGTSSEEEAARLRRKDPRPPHLVAGPNMKAAGMDIPEGLQDIVDQMWAESAPSNDASATSKIGRNDPCPCGSGKKYKKCCGK